MQAVVEENSDRLMREAGFDPGPLPAPPKPVPGPPL
jgi:hypothetical protein